MSMLFVALFDNCLPLKWDFSSCAWLGSSSICKNGVARSIGYSRIPRKCAFG